MKRTSTRRRGHQSGNSQKRLSQHANGTANLPTKSAQQGLETPGDDNVVRVLVRQSTGSGPRLNDYADSIGGGTGNRLEIIGSPRAFDQTNDGFEPAPPADSGARSRETLRGRERGERQ
mgnify:CR=1 FL=1